MIGEATERRVLENLESDLRWVQARLTAIPFDRYPEARDAFESLHGSLNAIHARLFDLQMRDVALAQEEER